MKILEIIKSLKPLRKKITAPSTDKTIVVNTLAKDNKESSKKNTRKEQLFINSIALLVLIGVVSILYNKVYLEEMNITKNQTVKEEKNIAPPLDKNLIAVNFPNPFIEMKNLNTKENKNQAPADNRMPVIPSGFQGNISIPGKPINIPPMQQIPPNTPQLPKAQSNNSKIQGITEGANGTNMAIMSDGSIVSEGDSFQDGRIAYIGGNGITFEDGHTLKYE